MAYRTTSQSAYYGEPEPEPEPMAYGSRLAGAGGTLGPTSSAPGGDLEQGSPLQLELEHVHARLHELELEGHDTAQYVEKLEQDILAAESELDGQRELKAELAQRIGDREHDSVEAYQRNADTLEQNAQMQSELQRLQADMSAVRADDAADRRRAAESEAQLAEEQVASEALFKQVQALEAEAQGLEATIQQRDRERELEHQTTKKLMADLARLAPAAAGGGGVDEALQRQVQLLEGQNQELIQELAAWNAKAAKQGAIHSAVGEMTAQPLQVRAENARLAAELDAVQRENARRHATLAQHAFSHHEGGGGGGGSQMASPAPSVGGGSFTGGAPRTSSATMQGAANPTSWF